MKSSFRSFILAFLMLLCTGTSIFPWSWQQLPGANPPSIFGGRFEGDGQIRTKIIAGTIIIAFVMKKKGFISMAMIRYSYLFKIQENISATKASHKDLTAIFPVSRSKKVISPVK